MGTATVYVSRVKDYGDHLSHAHFRQFRDFEFGIRLAFAFADADADQGVFYQNSESRLIYRGMALT
jgi:hypothetical protein